MIAIHHRDNSFSEQWVEYCKKNNIKYRLVNCYDNNILDQLDGVQALLWHWHHNDYKALNFAKSLTRSLELRGVKVFPNSDTVWHFDDKIAQKYLFESIKAPSIKSYVFYDLEKSFDWIEQTSFPKVFKLKGGAGAQNVSLIKTKNEARKFAKNAFSKGFKKINRFNQLKERFWSLKRDKNKESVKNLIKGFYRVVFPHDEAKNNPIEKNYLYAQDFVPNNTFDIRINVIGDKAFGMKRFIRDNDFRASGSGRTSYDPSEIPPECLLVAFDVAKKIKAQSASFDFVFLDKKPLIVEVSYGFAKGYLNCPGYWNSNLNWNEKRFYPEHFMMEDIIKSIEG